jgi:hypothetical protein
VCREVPPNQQICLFQVFQEVLVNPLGNSRCRVISVLNLICLCVSPVVVVIVWICLLLRLIVVTDGGVEISLFSVCCLGPGTVSREVLVVSSCTRGHRNCHTWDTPYLRLADIVTSVG